MEVLLMVEKQHFTTRLEHLTGDGLFGAKSPHAFLDLPRGTRGAVWCVEVQYAVCLMVRGDDGGGLGEGCERVPDSVAVATQVNVADGKR